MRSFGSTFALAAVTWITCLSLASGQESKPKASEPDAFKLPDGTIIFYASPDSKQTPTPNSVRLSAREYAALLDRAARADREAQSLAPSECQILASLASKADRSIATVEFRYRFKTTAPRTTVSLGGRGTFPVSARYDSGQVPVLRATDDGMIAHVDRPGEYLLTIVSEVNAATRQGGSEVGFETTLPGAVVTSLSLKPSPSTPENVTFITRSPTGVLESKRVSRTQLESTPDRPNGLPLGAATSLALTWDNPTTNATGITSAEFDVAIHVEDTLIDSTIRLRLKGPRKQWPLVLPARSNVVVEHVADKLKPVSDPRATVTPPREATGTGWIVTVPEPGEWLVTASLKQPRPDKASPGYLGHYPVGPLAVPDAMQQTGKIRFFAPPAVRIDTQHGSEIRAIDSPIVAGEAVADAAFSVRTLPVALPNQPPKPLMTFDVRPAPSLVEVKPSHRFRLTESGWRLKSELHIVPVLMDVNQLVVLIPSSWDGVQFGPTELVEAVQVIQDAPRTRRLAVRLTSNRKEPFDLALETTIPFSSGPRKTTAEIPLPTFLNTSVRETRVTASVPDGWTIKGNVNESVSGQVVRQMPLGDEGSSGTTPGPLTQISATCDRSATGVTLSWQPYRPDLPTTVTADVTVGDRQIVISETMTFSAQSPYLRPIRLRGPSVASGLRATPTLTPALSGEYTFVPPVDKKTFALTVSYAVPIVGKLVENELPIPLLWPDESTRTVTTMRIWLPPGKVYAGVKGPWREEPPTPSPDRDSWPTETISSIRNASDPAPGISLKILDSGPGDSSATHAIVERVHAQAWLGDEGTRRVRARYSLSRWAPNGLEWEIPADTVAEFWLDGKRVEGSPLPPTDGSESTCIRIPMPDARIGRPGVTLDLRLTARSDKSESKSVSLPTLRSALYRTSPYWTIVSPPGSIVLDYRRELSSAMVWKWRGAPFGLGLVPAEPFEDLTFRTGDENESDVASARPGAFGQSAQFESPMRFAIVPRTVFILVCSGGILAFGFLLHSVPSHRRGAPIALAVVLLALAVMIWPQMTGQSIVAAQPGMIIGLCLFAGLTLRKRWQVRHRRSLSAFERLGVEPKPVGDLSNDRTPGSQSRPQRVATPVPATAVPSTPSSTAVHVPDPTEPR